MKDLMKEVYEKVKFEWGMSNGEIEICFQEKEKVRMSSMGIKIGNFVKE